MSNPDNQVIRLTLPARIDLLPGALSLIRDFSNKLGLEEKDAGRIELVVEEACVNVIEHAFEGEIGSYDITLERRPGQIVLGIEDRGLPFDFKKFDEGQESGLGMVLMKAFADEVRFINQGRRGKRVEIVKNMPEKELEKYIREEHERLSGIDLQAVPKLTEADITIRLMRPEESLSLARCAYRCYGYTYSTDNFYFPERVRELIESGLMISVVAVTPENEIIGHLAMSKDSPETLVGESGQAIVDPRYRGQGILKKLKRFSRDYNHEQGMLGEYGEAVTVHTYSQKVALSDGASETGALLGFTPATMYFKDIQGEGDSKRRPIILFYSRLNNEPVRDVYLPPHHAGIMRRIYERLDMRRNIVSADIPELPDLSQVNIKVQTEASRAFMRVVEYGKDLEDLVKFRLKELCSKRIDCIFLDLPLSHPAVQRYCVSMEVMGFFFGGILPEIHNGDVLRLQYINNAEVEMENVEIAFDFSKEIYQYAIKASGLGK
ncbi:MAG: ATP-binding protein [Dehalococcoidales bacterium]|nr:ATP-binding protein [Dehalococcoidales bacterium]